MGKMKENPRYNVLSFRASDDELEQINAALNDGETVGDLLRAAALFCVALRKAPVKVTHRVVPCS